MSGITSVKLARVVAGADPNDIPPPKPTARGLGDPDIIQDAIRTYLTPIRPKRESEVVVELDGTSWDNLELIIVTQDCLLPGSWDLPLPVATEGEREECVREWLEGNGTVPSLRASPLCCVLTFPAGVSKSEYRWGIIEDD